MASMQQHQQLAGHNAPCTRSLEEITPCPPKKSGKRYILLAFVGRARQMTSFSSGQMAKGVMTIRLARPQKPGHKTGFPPPDCLHLRSSLSFGNGLHRRAPRCRRCGRSRLWGKGRDAASLKIDHLRPPLRSNCHLKVRGRKEADDGEPAVQIFLADLGISLTSLIQK